MLFKTYFLECFLKIYHENPNHFIWVIIIWSNTGDELSYLQANS